MGKLASPERPVIADAQEDMGFQGMLNSYAKELINLLFLERLRVPDGPMLVGSRHAYEYTQYT